MTYNMSMDQSHDNANTEQAAAMKHLSFLNRTNSLIVPEELINEANHANLINNHNMSYAENISALAEPSGGTQGESHQHQHQHVSNFINNHSHNQADNANHLLHELHRTKEIENLVDEDFNNEQQDDLTRAGLEIFHNKSHLKRTNELENLNEITNDD